MDNEGSPPFEEKPLNAEISAHRDVEKLLAPDTALSPDDVKYLMQVLDAYAEQHYWVPATERNFKMASYPDVTSQAILHLSLERDDGRTLFLDDLLPAGFHFIHGRSFLYHLKTKDVNVDPQRFGTKCDLIAILHEIGHSVTMPELRALYEEKSKAVNDAFPERLSAAEHPEEKRDAVDTPLVDVAHERDQARLDASYGLKSISERQADAFTLHMLRTIERAGFTPMADFTSPREVVEIVEHFLAYYELHRRGQLDTRHLQESKERPAVSPEKFRAILTQAIEEFETNRQQS